MPTCESCGATILWGLTKNDKRIPLDPVPVKNGNLDVQPMPENPEVVGRALYVKPDPDVERYVTHYATCVHGDEHRRQKAAAKRGTEGGGA